MGAPTKEPWPGAQALAAELEAAIQEVDDESVEARGQDYAFYFLLWRIVSIDPNAVQLLVDDLRSMAVRLRTEKFSDLTDPGTGIVRSIRTAGEG